MEEKLKGKNWVTTLLFCWFLGGFGAHRFYTGKSNSAWAMLIMTILGCTAPITAIWALIDGFTIALGQYSHADGSELYERIPWLGYVYIAFMVLAIVISILYAAAIFAMIGSLIGSGAGVPPVTP